MIYPTENITGPDPSEDERDWCVACHNTMATHGKLCRSCHDDKIEEDDDDCC